MGLDIQKYLKREPSPLLGVDFSSSAVKVVALSQGRGSSIRLDGYAIEPIERGAIVDGNIEKADVVADALSKAVRKAGSKVRNVALALPSASVITKRIRLPAGLREDDYEAQVESEASQYIPFSIDEVNLDFQILGPAAGGEDDVDVLLAASRKEKVEDRVAVAEMAGLKPMVMDVDSYAARAAIDHVVATLPNDGEGKIIAVFDIGLATTTMTVVLNGQTVFERQQPFGGQQLTQDIVRLYGLTPEEAEQKKRHGGLPDSYHEELVRPFVAQGASEIARAIQFFFTSTPHTRVDQILLAGGVATTPGLLEEVSTRTEVPTQIFTPFVGMEIAPDIREGAIRTDAPALLVCCGLAMRRFDA